MALRSQTIWRGRYLSAEFMPPSAPAPTLRSPPSSPPTAPESAAPMAALSPPPPVNPTGQLAQYLPGYDPAPVINAPEQSLQDYLNLPVKEILERLGLPPFADGKPQDGTPPAGAQPDAAQPQASPFDPSALISPVTDALGTLGSGLFDG